MTAAGIPALLEPIQERLDAATPGPWKAEPYGFGVLEDGRIRVTSSSDRGIYNTAEDVLPADAEFIAASPTDTARLLAAVKAVSDLHEHRTGEYRDMHGQCWIGDYCVECRDEWPCATVSAVEAALRDEA